MEQMAADIAELKRAALQTVDILVDHSSRLDRLERSIGGMQRSIGGMQHSIGGMQHSIDGRFVSLEGRFDAVTERLDRLIAATMAERTVNAERLGAIERRLGRLEQRLP
jgi:hypothetical protein